MRCDLGSVDDPRDPPCVRCRRESKDCVFSSTRRKRKAEDSIDHSEEPDNSQKGRNHRKHTGTSPPPGGWPVDGPMTPGGSRGRSRPLQRPDGKGRVENPGGFHEGDNLPMQNPEAQAALRRGVFGTHDALDLLYKAATDTDRLVESASNYTGPSGGANVRSPLTQSTTHKREESRASVMSVPPPQLPPPTISSAPDGSSRHRRANTYTEPFINIDQPVDPELGQTDYRTQPGYQEAIRAWTRFRFVRAGWFTPQEAIEYID